MGEDEAFACESTRPTCVFGAGVVVALVALLFGMGGVIAPATAIAQTQVVDLSVERMVELGMRDSYRIRQLRMDIERRRALLRANQASLKSRVDLRISAPDFRAISDSRWNSDLGREEIIRTNTRRWQMDLSVSQPVIIGGFTTNGSLSLNNRMYRYRQLGDDDDDIRYYNRYFIAYDQPLFQPNELKNDLENAELDVESAELSYESDVVRMIEDLADDYFELFEDAYERVIAERQVENIERLAAAASQLAAADSTRAVEVDQVQVEVANARQEVERTISSYRLQMENLKQDLRLGANDSLAVDPIIEVDPVVVDPDEAVNYALNLTPRMRQLEISRRESEIRLEETEGRSSFRMNLELTYGREMQDPRFGAVWDQPRNSYTVGVDAYMPIWDWGARRHRIEAQRISLERTDLRVEQTRNEIETDVRSEVRNLEEYQQRALNMEQTLELARQNTETALARYAAGEISLVDVLQTVNQERNTAGNLLDAYLGYRQALLRLQRMTYYDFEYNMRVLDRFAITP